MINPNEIVDKLLVGVQLLEDVDRDYILDKIEESRWKTGPTYNKGVHILMDVVQTIVEQSYRSPNG